MERFIHVSNYRARPDIQAICHHHAPAVMPFCVTGVPLVPVSQTGVAMGAAMVPFWDSRDEFGDTNLLVANQEQGDSIARTLGNEWMVLMRRHGACMVEQSLRELVFRTVYACQDANIQYRGQLIGNNAPVSTGEQSLIPMMALRVAYPGALVDINRIKALNCIDVYKQTLVIGALARHAHFHQPVVPSPLGELLATVAKCIAHYPIRQRGTFCGSLAHSDPASEWCLVTATLNGTIVLRSLNGTRELTTESFFLGAMTTDLAPNEILVQVRTPLLSADQLYGFYEFNRRVGDFAMGMSLVTFDLRDGVIIDPQIGIGGVEELPRRLMQTEAALNNKQPSADIINGVAEIAAQEVTPLVDEQVSTDYRRSIVRAVVQRAIEQALSSKEKRFGQEY